MWQMHSYHVSLVANLEQWPSIPLFSTILTFLCQFRFIFSFPTIRFRLYIISKKIPQKEYYVLLNALYQEVDVYLSVMGCINFEHLVLLFR